MSSYEQKFVERYIQSVHKALEPYDICVTIEEDFDEFLHHSRQLDGKSRPVDLFRDSFPRQSGFWLKGVDQFNRLVHTQAYRHVETPDQNLGQYLSANRLSYMSHGYGLDPTLSRFEDSPAASIDGDSFTYHGEVWLEQSKRGNSLALLLVRLGLAYSMQRWNPDYIFAFMYSRLVYKGIGAQYGYLHSTPGGAEWWQPDSKQFLNEWLVWSSREELSMMFRYPIAEEHACLMPQNPSRICAA